MKPNHRSTEPSKNPQWWLGACVVIGLVVGAGGLLPSLLGGDAGLSLIGKPAAERGSEVALSGPSPAAMLGRLAAGTVLVLALCAGTIPLLKRWVMPATAARLDGDFEVVASLPLAGRSSVCLVRAGGQHLLAGMDSAGLQILVPVGDVPANGEWTLPNSASARRVPAGIEPRRLSAV
jgi:Flagellar biosynthesis protein, FliO